LRLALAEDAAKERNGFLTEHESRPPSTCVHDWLRSNVIGLVAIFIALSGTAVATQVASKDGKATIAKAKVKRGPRGPAGPPGPAGPQGPQGPATGPASGDLTGNFPNPTIAPGAVTPDKLGVIPAVRAVDPWDSNGPGACKTFMLIPNNTVTPLTWHVVSFDTAGMHADGADCGDPSDSQLTAPRAGVYLISVGVLWSQNTTGTRYLGVNVNGVGRAADERQANGGAGAGSSLQSVTTAVALNPGDVITSEVNQTSGAPLILVGDDARSFFSAVWIGPVS
jgi:hypothetical protein